MCVTQPCAYCVIISITLSCPVESAPKWSLLQCVGFFYRVNAARRMAGHFPLSPDTPQYAAPVIHDRHSCEIALGIILIVTPIAIFPDRAERPVACWQTPVEAHASSRCTRKLDEATSIPPGARHPYAACMLATSQRCRHTSHSPSYRALGRSCCSARRTCAPSRTGVCICASSARVSAQLRLRDQLLAPD